MRLKSVFVRFYKSFNYDYIRKIKSDKGKAKPWEMLDDNFYPFVEVPIDPKITTIVGANESGKSHLLTAIEKGMTGRSEHCKNDPEINRKDFCRYSHFFKSTIDEQELPDFGFEWTDVSSSISEIRKICDMNEDRNFTRFFLFRFSGKKLVIYIPKKDEAGFDEFPIESVPNELYLVYLARGRDAEKPAVIVLLDSDKSGNEAKKNLTKAPHSGRGAIMDSSFILQLGDINIDDFKKINSEIERSIKLVDLEDLVPLELSILAAHKFLKVVYDFSDSDLAFISEQAITSAQKVDDSAFKTIQGLLIEYSKEANNCAVSIDKVPFARSVVDILPELERKRRNENNRHDGLKEFEINMRALFHRLRSMQSMAEKDIKDKRMRQKVDGKVETFLNDNSISPFVTRDEASRLLTDIESDLEGNDAESTFITQECKKLRATHNLTESLFENVRDFDGFIEGLEHLRHSASFSYKDRDHVVPSRRNADINEKILPEKPVNEKMDTIDTTSKIKHHTDLSGTFDTDATQTSQSSNAIVVTESIIFCA